MKIKLSAFLLLSLFALQAAAQSTSDPVNIGKGSIGLNGTAALSVVNVPASFNSTVTTITPTGSFFLADNLALIAGVSFTNNQETRLSSSPFGSSKSVGTRSLVGPVAGLAYYKPLLGRFGIRGAFLLGARFGTFTQEFTTQFGPSSSTESDLLELSASIVPSLYYRVSDRWLVEASFGGLNYTWNQESREGIPVDRESSTFDFSIRSGLGLGFTYLLSSK